MYPFYKQAYPYDLKGIWVRLEWNIEDFSNKKPPQFSKIAPGFTGRIFVLAINVPEQRDGTTEKIKSITRIWQRVFVRSAIFKGHYWTLRGRDCTSKGVYGEEV